MAAPVPSDFVAKFQADEAVYWQWCLAKQSSISDSISRKDLPALMNHDPEDAECIMALAPAGVQPCADTIREFGEAADTCTSELEVFVSGAKAELDQIQGSFGDDDTYAKNQPDRKEPAESLISKVVGTKELLESMDGKSTTQALLLRFSQQEVEAMGDAKDEHFEKLRKDLHGEHVRQTKETLSLLSYYNMLPAGHYEGHDKQKHMDSLQQKSHDAASKRDDAEMLCAGLERQKAETFDKVQRCAELRRKTARAEVANREAMEEAKAVFHKACEEHHFAYIRNEAAVLMEDRLNEAYEMTNRELDAAKDACARAGTQCVHCEEKAAFLTKELISCIEALHTSLLAHSRPFVEEAWKNTAIANELCKCVLATKQTEINHLSEAQSQFERRASNQKQPKSKAQTLEQVEQLKNQISKTKEELSEFENMSSKVEVQLSSFRSLKSEVDEAAIIRIAKDAADACYGSFKLYVSDADSDDDSTEASGPTSAIQQHRPQPMEKLRIEMEEKLRIQKQQLLAEFQFEKQQMLQLMREEIRAEMQREDASSVITNSSFEHVDS